MWIQTDSPLRSQPGSRSPLGAVPQVACWLLLGLSLAACAPTRGPAPIESRTISPGKTADQRSASGKAIAELPPVPAGSYRVKRGDTLVSIALEYGVDWRDLVSWNGLDNPNVIEVGQILRVRPPEPRAMASAPAEAPAQGATPIQPGGAMEVRPLTQGQAAQTPADPAAGTEAAASRAGQPAEVASGAPSSAAPVAGLNWSWPANGQVIAGFSEGGSKGISIAGAPGESIFAAEQGRVVYSGNGLRGYGNLVIVKHEGDFLTAYAHNRAILVKEGQVVRRGQKIAELGMSDADRPMLHFEVRKGGKPVDPMAYLPKR